MATTVIVIVILVDLFPTRRIRTITVVRAYLNCPDGPTSTRHIDDGVGTCHLWGPHESAYDCCVLCNEANSIASQYLRPGEKVPLGGFIHNSATCCCYSGGHVVDRIGGRGDVYYLQPSLKRH